MHIKRVHLLQDKYPTQEHYPFNLEIFQKTRQLEFNSPITFFMGENGTGKSSLLRGLANKSRIHIWESPQIRRIQYNPYESLMHYALSLEWANGQVPGSYFGSQIFNHFTQILEEWSVADPGVLEYYGGESLLTLSHGQSLISYFKARYKVRGLYLLDEPETALSPKSQVQLVRVLLKAIESGTSQFIIATHSPILLATPGAQIYSFDDIPIQTIDYEDTEYFEFYRDFMNDRHRFF